MQETNITTTLLIIRFSAMGDVALLVPVVQKILAAHPQIRILLVTRKTFFPFFNLIPGLELVAAELETSHRGLLGLFRLYRELRKKNIDIIADLHGVIRSYVLSLLFRWNGKKIFRLKKGRKDKILLTRGKISGPLLHTSERYLNVFREMKLQIPSGRAEYIRIKKEALSKTETLFAGKGTTQWIGVAPFARHHLKTWPMEKMKLLLKRIKQEQPARFFFLGGGQNELHVMDGLVDLFPGSVNVVKEMDLETELALISRLDLMISMDSSNMHTASLLGVKTVTIWGGTHPYAGFSAYHEKNAVNIQIPKSELSCRPCTVYGKGKCHRGDFACMENLSADKVYEQLKEAGVLSQS